MIENPAERVFHIDRECYLVYLGSSHTEYRPFLRIGNSTKLPAEVKKYISTVLVTDNYTGNPFLEHENLELPLNGETRFVGDPARIERLKQFLNEKNLPVAEYEYETVESPPQKGRSIVFFFKNGNLHVHHNGDELYNLRQREIDDLHFVYLAERVSSFIKDNPLRYLSKAFQNPGFIFLGKQLYFFNEGRLGVVHVPEDFLYDLSLGGIDPDLLQWAIEDQFEEGILRKLKRSMAIKKELRVASHRSVHLRSMINLFSGMGASLFAVEPNPAGCFHLQGFTFCGEELTVEFPSSLGITFRIPPTLTEIKNIVEKALEKKGLPARTKLIGNIPYRFQTSPLPSPSNLLLMYGINVAKNCTEVGDVKEQDWWRALVSTLTQIQEQWKKASPRISSFESVEPLLTQGHSLEATKNIFPFLIWNLGTLSNVVDPSVGERGGVWERLRKKLGDPNMYRLPEERGGCIPLVGDFWSLPNGMSLFYQIEGRLTPLRLLQATKSIENIEKLRASVLKEDQFVQERERLLRFLEQLHQVPPKRVKKAVATQAPASNEPEPSLSTLQPSSAQSPEPSAQTSEHPGATGMHTDLAGLSTQKTPFSVTSSERERIGATSKGRESVFQSLFHRSWGIYLLGGVFLMGLILALWHFDLFPHRKNGNRPITGTPTERSIAPEPPGGKTEPITQGKESILPTSKIEEPAPTQSLTLKEGDVAGGQKDRQERREVQPGQDQRKVPQQDAAQQKNQEIQKTIPGMQDNSLPSTYTASIPPLGAIQITVLDVFHLVNEIADANGYRRLNSPKDLRPDPNWIYPENRFKLPDSSVYIVKRGDTLWGITTRYIEQEVAKGIEVLKSYLGPALESTVPKDKKSELERIMEDLQQGSHCKAFVEYLKRKKEEVVYR